MAVDSRLGATGTVSTPGAARVRASMLLAGVFLASAAAGEFAFQELHKDNFDEALEKNEEVLVHFYAPWSKRCETMRPALQAIGQGEPWGERLIFAQSDISDQRGYTSYLERYGVLKLPTVVLFRNGHPSMYPLDEPLTQEGVESWLQTATQGEALPRGASEGAVDVQMQDAQNAAVERIRQHQMEASRQEKAQRDGKLNAADGVAAAAAQVQAAQAAQAVQATTPGDASDEGSAAAVPSGEAAASGGRKLEQSPDNESSCPNLKGAGLTDGTFEKFVMDKKKVRASSTRTCLPDPPLGHAPLLAVAHATLRCRIPMPVEALPSGWQAGLHFLTSTLRDAPRRILRAGCLCPLLPARCSVLQGQRERVRRVCRRHQ
jgi:thioredoxin-like negative regulator of GroEL